MPCSCGSGLKRKHCSCHTRRPRKTSILFDYGIPEAINGLRISESGLFSLQHNGNTKHPIAAHIETTYERIGKHPKVIHYTPLDPAAPWVNPNIVLERFDLLLAIDTNTISYSNGTISLAVVVKCRYSMMGENRLAQWEPIHAIEFHNINGQAERIGWRSLIQSIIADPGYTGSDIIGIIVDSDLGNIRNYNSRNLPIEGDFFLPPGFELLYATADTGSEFVANRMLARADKVSTTILKQITEGTISENELHPAHNAPYTHYRIWTLLPSPENQ